MKRRYQEVFEEEEEHSIKRSKLNDGTAKVVKHNYEQIQQLMSNQQQIFEEFKKTINLLKDKLNNSEHRVNKLEETVEKQQLVLRQVMPPTKFSSSPPSYYC